MTKPTDIILRGPDDGERDSIFHPVLLAVMDDEGVDFTGVGTIEFLKGRPNTPLPFRLVPAPDGQYIMALVGRDRAEFLENLDEFALWTPAYAAFFNLDTAYPVLLLDAFEQ